MNEIKQTPEYQSLLKRFRHLLESKTIAEFDEVIPQTYGEYRKNIYAFDEYIKGLKAAIKELIIENEQLKASQPVRCKDCVKRKTEDCSMYYECECGEQHTWEVDDDYCSVGERRVEE